MEFEFQDWTLKDLIDLHDSGNLNLNPPYQRGDIWTLSAKKKLIDSIKLKYPLPIFFLFQTANGKMEMVDGQQRTRTILGYSKGLFPDLSKQKIEDTDKDFFYNSYKIAVCIIQKALSREIEDFYYRVNKFGTKLNRPEIFKAQYANTRLQVLVEKISDSNEFEGLNLFTDKSLDRLNDLDFVGELLTLLKYGITERKFTVDKFYNDTTFSDDDASNLEKRFYQNLQIISGFNELFPIKNTRYRQRSDFYTLMSFTNIYINLPSDVLNAFYKLLVSIGEDISPSNEKCFALQEYAINCVSLSHTEKARKMRLSFLEDLLLNKDPHPIKSEENLTVIDLMNFYKQSDAELIDVSGYFLLDFQKIQEITSRKFF